MNAAFLRWLAWFLFMLAALALVWGGGIISRITGTDRVLAEIEGVGLTLVCAGLGAALRHIAERKESNGTSD